MIQAIRLKFKQFLCDHLWDKTRGFYDEPAKGAVCHKCKKVNQ